ncbi:hypothetical protein BLNAU_19651 [Blattamonas nauphoetae]|uniref:SPRY domain-containing protein n=1 Tax=Blattamonas nauphoetae TaxID=2049346 RepID=A0ABQ9X0Y0_9EUKA|nr:hypothetical protein BLNAU_19651 [Blattamonas nauphoetae]
MTQPAWQWTCTKVPTDLLENIAQVKEIIERYPTLLAPNDKIICLQKLLLYLILNPISSVQYKTSGALDLCNSIIDNKDSEESTRYLITLASDLQLLINNHSITLPLSSQKETPTGNQEDTQTSVPLSQRFTFFAPDIVANHPKPKVDTNTSETVTFKYNGTKPLSHPTNPLSIPQPSLQAPQASLHITPPGLVRQFPQDRNNTTNPLPVKPRTQPTRRPPHMPPIPGPHIPPSPESFPVPPYIPPQFSYPLVNEMAYFEPPYAIYHANPNTIPADFFLLTSDPVKCEAQGNRGMILGEHSDGMFIASKVITDGTWLFEAVFYGTSKMSIGIVESDVIPAPNDSPGKTGKSLGYTHRGHIEQKSTYAGNDSYTTLQRVACELTLNATPRCARFFVEGKQQPTTVINIPKSVRFCTYLSDMDAVVDVTIFDELSVPVSSQEKDGYQLEWNHTEQPSADTKTAVEPTQLEKKKEPTINCLNFFWFSSIQKFPPSGTTFEIPSEILRELVDNAEAFLDNFIMPGDLNIPDDEPPILLQPKPLPVKHPRLHRRSGTTHKSRQRILPPRQPLASHHNTIVRPKGQQLESQNWDNAIVLSSNSDSDEQEDSSQHDQDDVSEELRESTTLLGPVTRPNHNISKFPDPFDVNLNIGEDILVNVGVIQPNNPSFYSAPQIFPCGYRYLHKDNCAEHRGQRCFYECEISNFHSNPLFRITLTCNSQISVCSNSLDGCMSLLQKVIKKPQRRGTVTDGNETLNFWGFGHPEVQRILQRQIKQRELLFFGPWVTVERADG